MRSLPFLTRREHPAALSTARAFHPRLIDSRGHQLLTRDVRPHAAMYHPIVRPRKHESSSTADRGERKGADARAGSAERHEGADYLQRQAAAAARLALPTRPACAADTPMRQTKVLPSAPRTRARRAPSTTKWRQTSVAFVSFYATLLKCRLMRLKKEATDGDGRVQHETGPLSKNVPPLGIGDGTIIENAIIDKNVRIGRRAKVINDCGLKELPESKQFTIRDGVIVVPKNAVLPEEWKPAATSG